MEFSIAGGSLASCVRNRSARNSTYVANMPVAVASTEVIIYSSTESLEILLGQITTAAGDEGRRNGAFCTGWICKALGQI